jgi:hypothetical protein
MDIFQDKTKESIYCPTWTGISSPKSPLNCPCCQHSFEPGLDPQLEALYASDNFRMYRFKVQRCPSSLTTHDWTDCPYLHPGEKARRRDPRKFHYSSELCADFRKNGKCAKRDTCRLAHGVFEMWLHPDKYRTELCRDGTGCTRKVCFFAHTVGQLRWPGNGDDNLISESEMSSTHVSSSQSGHMPMLSSLLSALIADMQRTSISEMGRNQTFCSFDRFRDGAVEVPDIRWVSDLVDF